MIGYVSMSVVEGLGSGSNSPANRSFFHHRHCCGLTVPELSFAYPEHLLSRPADWPDGFGVAH